MSAFAPRTFVRRAKNGAFGPEPAQRPE